VPTDRGQGSAMQPFPFDTPNEQDVDTVAVGLLAWAPVLRAAMGGGELWLALSHDAVRQVLSDPRFSRQAAMGPDAPVVMRSAYDPDVLTSLDPPGHSRTRRLMSRAFSPRMVDTMAPRVAEIVAGLLDDLDAHGAPADLIDLFAAPLPIMVICELLGVPYADRAAIQDWSRRLVPTTAYPPEEITAAAGELDGYLAELVAAKRAAPTTDLTSALIQATDEQGALTESELVKNVRMLLVGGHETTVNQLGNSVLALFRHPDQLALLRDRPELVTPAVEELLRYSRLIGSTLPRVAVADVKLGGQLIRTGDGVIALTSAANVDPRVFAAPDRLDITRGGSGQHLSFGHGPHFCLGAHLARLELRTALTGLLARFGKLTLAVEESELRWREGTPLRSLHALPVTW
jgi:nocardicin N-oxygenase